MNDTLVFQHIYSNTEAAGWTALAVPRLIRYCHAYSMDFQYIQADPPHYHYREHNIGHWAIPYYLREFMGMGYNKIIYIDHDCILADMNADFRDACKENFIGAVWHDRALSDPTAESHYNDGALYVSNTARVRMFVDDWLAEFPGGEPWFEQGVFNRLGGERNIINRIDDRWNSGYINRSLRPVVIGLHGMPYRGGRVKEKILELEAQESQ